MNECPLIFKATHEFVVKSLAEVARYYSPRVLLTAEDSITQLWILALARLEL